MNFSLVCDLCKATTPDDGESDWRRYQIALWSPKESCHDVKLRVDVCSKCLGNNMPDSSTFGVFKSWFGRKGRALG